MHSAIFRMVKRLFWSFFVLLFPVSCCLAAEQPLKKVNLVLQWKPQAQFAGYLVAIEKGIYRRHGLEVNLQETPDGHLPEEMLKSGKADFAVLWLSSAVEQRAKGVLLVNIGQVVQRSALMLVAKKSSGIIRPQDMRGKKISLWEGPLELQPKAFFRKYGIEAQIIPQSYTVNLFLAGGVDIASAMWYNEYDTMVNSGVNPEELVTFSFRDYGLDFPEDGIYCLEEAYRKDPGAAREFSRASLEGWQYAFDHPQEALDIVLGFMRRAHLPANRVHQEWMLARMKDLILDPALRDGLGVLQKDDYEQVAQTFISEKIIERAPAYEEFYIPDKKP